MTSKPTSGIGFISFMTVGIFCIFVYDKACGPSPSRLDSASRSTQAAAATDDRLPEPMPSFSEANDGFSCSDEKQSIARGVIHDLTTPQDGLDSLVASVRETRSGGVVYTFGASSWDVTESHLTAMVEAISNADACIEGRARRIDFQSPGGERVAFADPKEGVKLLH